MPPAKPRRSDGLNSQAGVLERERQSREEEAKEDRRLREQTKVWNHEALCIVAGKAEEGVMELHFLPYLAKQKREHI
ncbi:hypothetical protein ACOMHN_056694 [Nucella lapillus]